MKSPRNLAVGVVSTFLALAFSLRAADTNAILKATSFESLLASANAGEVESQLKLARGHAGLPVSGVSGGIPINQTEATKWYSKVATAGNVEGQSWMGQRLFNQANLTSDKRKRLELAQASLNWLMKAAWQGSIDAWGLLGQGFEEGKVFAKDQVEAYKWFHLLVLQKKVGGIYVTGPLSTADTSRNRLSLILSPAQIDQAKQRALDFMQAREKVTGKAVTATGSKTEAPSTNGLAPAGLPPK